MNNTLLLVDGSSYLYRAYHGMPGLTFDNGEPGGFPVGAMHGIINMLRALRKEYPAAYLACVFDAKGKTFRDDMYDQYKANRAPMPDDLRRQIEPIHRTVRALGWPLLMVPGVEADDVIGTLAVEASKLGMKTVVSTGDKDLAQLVNDNVTLINTMSNEKLDRDGVIAKFGVPPELIIDYLTLIGDTVDNVPGVVKCGPKTALKWLQEYGTLANVMANADKIGGVVGQNLRNALEWLPQGRALITVKLDCDLSEHLQTIPTSLQAQLEDAPALHDIFTEFGFKTALRELRAAHPELAGAGAGATNPQAGAPNPQAGSSAGAGSPAQDSAPGRAHEGGAAQGSLLDFIPKPERHYETVLLESQLDVWLAKISAASLTSIDTETTSLDTMQAQMVGISLCVEVGTAAYIPLAHRYPGVPDQLGRDFVLGKLKHWLESESHAKVGQNLKYDSHVFANHGITLRGIAHDTLLASYVLEAHKPHDMDSLARRHLNQSTISFEEVCGKGASQIGFDDVDLARATDYAAEDADITLQLHQCLWPQIETCSKLDYIYRKIELPTAVTLQKIERNGVLIDAALLGVQSQELGKRLLELETGAYELAGQQFNLNSPKQLGEIFFEKMKLPVVKKTPSGAPSTDEEVLQKLAEDFPLPKLLLEYRGLAKLKSTYTDKLPKMVNPRTGRVHTNYAQAVAVTGRLASNDPNLQNIPIRTLEGRRIREAFIAPPGSHIISADYSQIELRIMAHISGDEAMLRAFADGVDIHRATAAEVFGVASAEVSSEQRRYAKVINFGLIYGMGAFGLASNLGIERGAAQQYIERYFQRFAGVKRYMEQTRIEAKARGYVETVFGRRLWLPEINSPNGPRKAGAERAAINAPMQGTAADLIKLAMVAVQDWLEAEKLQSLMIMQVHDELILEVPEAELELVKQHLPRLMAGVAELKVPLLAEVGVGKNWDQAH
jgi:DNA polymerase-1